MSYKTLEQYLRESAEKGQHNHMVQSTINPEGSVEFSIRPTSIAPSFGSDARAFDVRGDLLSAKAPAEYYTAEKIERAAKAHTRAEIERDIIKTIADRISVRESEIRPDDTLNDDLGIDSLEVVELSMHLEETYRIEIPDEQNDKWKTVRDVIDTVLPKLPYGPRERSAVSDDFRPWDGKYDKRNYDVRLSSGEIVTECWPNAGRMCAMDGTGREWIASDNIEVRESPEEEDTGGV